MNKQIMHISAAILSLFMLVSCAGNNTGNEQTKTEQRALEIIGEDNTDPVKALSVSSHTSSSTADKLVPLRLQKSKEKKYTVMIYMTGSNLESLHGAATRELQEIMRQQFDANKVNVLVYTGGTRTWKVNIPSTCNTVYALAGNRITAAARTSRSSNMGAAASLTDFVNYAVDYYPAENYSLIFWDHGGGPLWGCCGDELFQNDSLTLNEMRTAMSQTVFKDRHLDFVGFDACLMGNIEVASLWQNYADYMIASEELEKGNGWDYSFLSLLAEDTDHQTLFDHITASYRQSYESSRREDFNPDYTLAVYKLSLVQQVQKTLSALADEMEDDIESRGIIHIARNLAGIRRIGISDSEGEQYGLVDIGSFTEQTGMRYRVNAQNLASAVRRMICSSVSSSDTYSGMSLYFPSSDPEKEYSGSGVTEMLAVPEYAQMLDTYYAQRQYEDENNWNFGQDQFSLTENEDEFIFQLTDYQTEHAAEVSYGIYGLFADTTDYKSPVLLNIPLDLNNGTIRIPRDPKVFVASGDISVGNHLMSFRQTQGGEEPKYRALWTMLTADYGTTDDGDTNRNTTLSNKYAENVSLAVKVTPSGEVAVESVSAKDLALGQAERESVQILSRNQELTNIFQQWDTYKDNNTGERSYIVTGASGMTRMGLNEEIRVSTCPVSQLDAEFIFNIVVRDIYGNTHASDFCYMMNKENLLYYEGVQYLLKDDEYVLAGTDAGLTSITVPAEINGIPITGINTYALAQNKTVRHMILPDTIREIGDDAFSESVIETIEFGSGLERIGYYAFSGCENLKEVTLPGSLKMISRYAFNCCSLQNVKLPASLTYFDGSSFSGNPITLFEVDQANTSYVSDHNTVYTKDRKKLVYCAAAGESFKVPEGTEVIGFSAFRDVSEDSALKTVDLPDTLTEIDDFAFFGCSSLEGIELPEALVRIGDYAFDNFPSEMMTPNVIWKDDLYIGKNVEYIGDHAFAGQGIRGYSVDENNMYYASKEGYLTDKAGNTILAVPNALNVSGDPVKIPEGITTIPEDLFDNFYPDQEYIIPSSVYRFGANTFSYWNSFPYIGSLFTKEGSAAEQYAKMNKISYQNDDTGVQHLEGDQLLVLNNIREMVYTFRMPRSEIRETIAEWNSSGQRHFTEEQINYALERLQEGFKEVARTKLHDHVNEELCSRSAVHEKLLGEDFTEAEIDDAFKQLSSDFFETVAQKKAEVYARDSEQFYASEEIRELLIVQDHFTDDEAQYAVDHLQIDYTPLYEAVPQEERDRIFEEAAEVLNKKSYSRSELKKYLLEQGYSDMAVKLFLAVQDYQPTFKEAAMYRAAMYLEENGVLPGQLDEYTEKLREMLKTAGFTEREIQYALEEMRKLNNAEYNNELEQAYSEISAVIMTEFYSKPELHDYLIQKGYTEATAEQVIQYYTDQGLFELCAEMRAAEYLNSKMIKPETFDSAAEEDARNVLREAGFTEEEIEGGLELLKMENPNRGPEYRDAEEALESYYYSRTELHDYLIQKGYAWETVDQAITYYDEAGAFGYYAALRAGSYLHAQGITSETYNETVRENLRNMLSAAGFTEEEITYALLVQDEEYGDPIRQRALGYLWDECTLSRKGLKSLLASAGDCTEEQAESVLSEIAWDYRENALAAAKEKLDLGPYSASGLYQNLIEDEGFTEEEAQYAIDHVEADYKKNALETANSMLKYYNTPVKIKSMLLNLYKYTEEEADYALANISGGLNAEALSKAYDEVQENNWSKEYVLDYLHENDYSEEQIAYVTENLHVDFNEVALKAAKEEAKFNYSLGRIRSDLGYGKFTREEVQYAAEHLHVDFNKSAKITAETLAKELQYSKAEVQSWLVKYGLFTEEEAQYAADHMTTDFNEIALMCAEQYAENLNMSKSEIKKRLVEYDGFTKKEADYAVKHMKADFNLAALRKARQYREDYNQYSTTLTRQYLQTLGFTNSEINYAIKHLNDKTEE